MYLRGDVKLSLVTVINRLILEIKVVRDLSCHPIYNQHQGQLRPQVRSRQGAFINVGWQKTLWQVKSWVIHAL